MMLGHVLGFRVSDHSPTAFRIGHAERNVQMLPCPSHALLAV